MDLLSWWWNCSASWIRRRPDSTRFQQSKLFSKFENNTKIKKKDFNQTDRVKKAISDLPN